MSSPDTDAGSGADLPEDQEQVALSMDVEVEARGACQRHVLVCVSRPDVDRYLEEAFDDLQPKAEVRGFRPGRAPRKLVETQFKDQIHDQVKGKILMDALAQVSDEENLSAISEPAFDFDAISIPDEGPFKFEFDIEVRPEFDVPDWQGMRLARPVREYSDEEVEEQLQHLLARYGKRVERPGPAEAGDVVTADVTVEHEGRKVAEHAQVKMSVVPQIRFSDATIYGFDQLVTGAAKDDVRQTTATISPNAANQALRDQEVDVRLKVGKVERVQLPQLTPSFLDEIGGFEDEDDLREVVRAEMDRQWAFRQQQWLRQQITDQLLQGADWELPPDLLRRQSHRELERRMLELQSSGYSQSTIRAHANELKQDALRVTERALKEHFMLEKIADEEGIDVSDQDYDAEIGYIAAQRDEPVRRVRARLEKQGQMDALRNQIVERKVLDLISQQAEIVDQPVTDDQREEEADGVDLALAGGHDTSDIPEAKHGGEPENLRSPVDRS